MSRRLFIYIQNHGKQQGIQDFLTTLEKVFGSRGFEIEVSSTLRANSVNIIIDEFTSVVENLRIAEFCSASLNNRCIFLLTEFTECRWGVESFNHFAGLRNSAIIALFNVVLRWERSDFPALRARDCAVLLVYSPLVVWSFLTVFVEYIARRLLYRSTRRPVAAFLFKYRTLIYLHMRYLGLKAHLAYADGLITSHESTLNSSGENQGIDERKLKHFGVLYPEFDEDVEESLMKDKNLHLEVTGSISLFRKRWMKWIDFRIQLLGLTHRIGWCVAMQFALSRRDGQLITKKHLRGAYSLHPPQSRRWPFCSPMRIYRAVAVDHNVPVLTRHFSQHPIEDICMVLKDASSYVAMVEMFSNRHALRHFMGPRIQTYNAIAKQRNDILVKSLEEVSSDRC